MRKFVFILPLLFFQCKRIEPIIPEVSFPQAIEYAKSQDDSTFLLVCDFRQFNHIEKSRFFRVFRREHRSQFFYADLSLSENRYAQYVLGLEMLPAILVFDQKGQIGRVIYFSSGGSIINHIQFSNEVDKEYNHLLEIGNRISCGETLSTCDLFFLQNYSDTLIGSYLLAKSYANSEEADSARLFVTRLVDIVGRNKIPINEARLLDVLSLYKDTTALVSFSPKEFFLNIKPDVTVITDSILVKNYGSSILYFLNSYTSCRCVSIISQPFSLGPQEEGFIKFSINNDGTRGTVHQHISIITNASNAKAKQIPIIISNND